MPDLQEQTRLLDSHKPGGLSSPGGIEQPERFVKIIVRVLELAQSHVCGGASACQSTHPIGLQSGATHSSRAVVQADTAS